MRTGTPRKLRITGWPGGNPNDRGCATDVVEPDRLRLVDEQAEHTAAGRQVADGVVLGDGHPVGDELDQRAVGADDAQRAVAGIGHLARRDHDPRQGAAQIEFAADADDGPQQRRQSLPARHHRTRPGVPRPAATANRGHRSAADATSATDSGR